MFAQRVLSRFDAAYLSSLRKSDFEIIADRIVRDVGLCVVLPREQRVAVANMLRDEADLLEEGN